MDPTQAIGVAKDLGAGSAQMILGFLSVALATGFGWALWRLIGEIKSCGAERTDLLGRNIEAQHRVAASLDNISEVMKAALEALKGR
jgi:hypothetical protein